MSHIKQCLITLRFFPKAALTHLTRYQQINSIPSCITSARGQYTVTKFNCRKVKEVFEKNLGMGLLNLKLFRKNLKVGEWAPLFFLLGALPPSPLLSPVGRAERDRWREKANRSGALQSMAALC